VQHQSDVVSAFRASRPRRRECDRASKKSTPATATTTGPISLPTGLAVTAVQIGIATFGGC